MICSSFVKEILDLITKLYDCFLNFFATSGLIANASKSSSYFGGVREKDQQHILNIHGFVKRELPFRYFGVPLSTKRLSIIQCQPLIEKMIGRITRWTTILLSYAGRVQLIQSVLFSIQTFWSQFFVLPMKVVKIIKDVYKRFLWTGGTKVTRKALIAWDKRCNSKLVGGINMLDVLTWNKVAIIKLLWNLSMKKDKLWVQWVNTYKRKAY